jgi:hypothetical protein
LPAARITTLRDIIETLILKNEALVLTEFLIFKIITQLFAAKLTKVNNYKITMNFTIKNGCFFA